MARKKITAKNFVEQATGVRLSAHEKLCAERMKHIQESIKELSKEVKLLRSDVSKGKGEHFSALSKLYGCEDEYIQTFESMLYGNYTHLFEEISDIEKYERAHLLDYEINRLMKNYRIKEFCKFSS